MHFNCTIEMYNDAFAYKPSLELSIILNKLAAHLERFGDLEPMDGYLRDTNGNKVGYYKLEGSSVIIPERMD